MCPSFTEKEPAPGDFLATSTTSTQCQLRELIDQQLGEDEEPKEDETQKGIMAEMKESIMKEMKESIMAETKESIMAEVNRSMAEMKELIKWKNQDILDEIVCEKGSK